MPYILSIITMFFVGYSVTLLWERQFRKFTAWFIAAIILIFIMFMIYGDAAYLAMYTTINFGLTFIFFKLGMQKVYNIFVEFFHELAKFFHRSIGPFPNQWTKYGASLFSFLLAVIFFRPALSISINEDMIARHPFFTISCFILVSITATTSGLFWKTGKVWWKAPVNNE